MKIDYDFGPSLDEFIEEKETEARKRKWLAGIRLIRTPEEAQWQLELMGWI